MHTILLVALVFIGSPSLFCSNSDSLQTSLSPSSAHIFTEQALEKSFSFLKQLSSAQKRDSTTQQVINSLIEITHKAHDSSLSCKQHLSSMMFLATSEAARKLHSAPNILLFRMRIHDTELFLSEARKYWREGR